MVSKCLTLMRRCLNSLRMPRKLLRVLKCISCFVIISALYIYLEGPSDVGSRFNMNDTGGVRAGHFEMGSVMARDKISLGSVTKASTDKFGTSIRTPAPIFEPNSCQYHEHPFFPLCLEKMRYLQLRWSKDFCFQGRFNTSGSQCAYNKYLTQIEPFCVGEKSLYEKNHDNVTLATTHLAIEGLLDLLPADKYKWMRRRAKQMWDSWAFAAKAFAKKRRSYLRKKVLVYMPTIEANNFLQRAWNGGPLGELIQWTDTITALYVLGHDVTVAVRFSELSGFIKGADKEKCATGKHAGMPDIIYIDLWGVKDLKANLGDSAANAYWCRLRILDSFGTYAEHNDPHYPHMIPGGKSRWGLNQFLLTQVLTLYPHTHDNSFLGFVVSSNNILIKNKTKQENIQKKGGKPRALIYAKKAVFLKALPNFERYLHIVSEYFNIHATINGDLPPSVRNIIHNHGIVSGARVHELLSQSKLFLGMGFPFEGPGPLEAMANGVVYLQPRYQTPYSKLNNQFFRGKPTLRELTSQNPYMEEFVGKPYCYTIDVTDDVTVRSTLEEIKTMKRPPNKIPKEFTTEGMLDRLYVYNTKMDYCNPYAPRWPPLQNRQVFFSVLGQSCKDACMAKGLVCERSYFDEINIALHIEKYSGVKCKKVKHLWALHAPSLQVITSTCYVQARRLIFSCMHKENGFQRLCPCRDYQHEQIAICKNCI